LEGHRAAADPTDLVGGALAKIARALPERISAPMLRVRDVRPPMTGENTAAVKPDLTSQLIEACSAGHRLRIAYDTGRTEPRRMEVDPWAVVLRHSYWYLLCWSQTVDALR